VHLHDYRATFRLGGSTFELHPGTVTLTAAGVESRYDLPKNGFHLCIHFDPVTAADSSSVTLPVFWHAGTQAPFVTMQMRHITDLYRQAQQSGAAGARARNAAGTALQALLAWLAFAARQPASTPGMQRSRASLDLLVQILDERFCEPLTVPALAREVSLSQNYLVRLFRQRMGVTVQQYLANRRIELARHLLTTTGLSIKEIGARVGWPAPQHFNKQFHRLAGLSPSASRALATGRQRNPTASYNTCTGFAPPKSVRDR
jgi:AraC-like DNA-binding protein